MGERKMKTVRIHFEEEMWPVHILVTDDADDGGTAISVPDDVADRWARIKADFQTMQEELEVYCANAPEEP